MKCIMIAGAGLVADFDEQSAIKGNSTCSYYSRIGADLKLTLSIEVKVL
jgi:hypothetical protein